MEDTARILAFIPEYGDRTVLCVLGSELELALEELDSADDLTGSPPRSVDGLCVCEVRGLRRVSAGEWDADRVEWRRVSEEGLRRILEDLEP